MISPPVLNLPDESFFDYHVEGMDDTCLDEARKSKKTKRGFV